MHSAEELNLDAIRHEIVIAASTWDLAKQVEITERGGEREVQPATEGGG